MNSPYKGMNKEEIIKVNPNWGSGQFKEGNTLRKGQKDSNKTRKKKSIARLGENNPMYGKRGELCPHFGKKRPEQSKLMKKLKISKRKDVRNKIRLATIKYIKEIRGNISPNIGKYEKQILDYMELFIGYNIIRQFEIEGYFVDGYIPELNLAIEIDERPKTKQRDIEREGLIKSKLKCSFIRIPTYKIKIEGLKQI